MTQNNEDKAGLWAYAWRTVTNSVHDGVWRRDYYFHNKRKWKFDWANPATRIAVEVDGALQMVRYRKDTGQPVAVGRHNQDPDMWKIAEAVALGWAVFRFTPAMLENNPTRCVELVMRMMRR